ncbi:sec14 cytosolic factor-like [Apium graveolens]|uniref:sec14 cytosolic factor-like n=1 Tax=Apium graveolens TaxID=4045 RepID=UPI003D7BA1B9
MEGQVMKKPISNIGMDSDKTVQEDKQDEDNKLVMHYNIGSHINQEEDFKVDLMRKLVEKHDPSVKEVDNSTLRRFLRARDHDIEKGNAMFLKYLNWKQTFMPKGYISESEISNHLAQNKQFLQGEDKQGRPITVLLGGRHFPKKIPGGGVEELKRFVVYALEKTCSRMPAGQEKFVVISDLEGWGYSNTDIRSYIAALSILQDYYPERLGKLFIVHVPYIFMTVWKLVYPFIDNNSKKKLVFVENKRLKETLMEDIEESQIPAIYGGKLPLVPIQHA